MKIEPIRDFVTRRGARLYLNNAPFRFIGCNIPNLHIIEDGPESQPWLVPSDWEIEDALKTARYIGGSNAVARLYTPRFGLPGCDDADLRHVILPDTYNERLFAVYDRILESATRNGVRLIVPLINPDRDGKWAGTGSYEDYCGEAQGSFYTSAKIRPLFFAYVTYLLNRMNPLTGLRYGEHPCILAWQSGNELNLRGSRVPAEFTISLAKLVKSLSPNSLFCDGSTDGEGGFGWEPPVLACPEVDMVTTHLYSNMTSSFVKSLLQTTEPAGKALFVGEFGFNDLGSIKRFSDGIAGLEPCAGALVWSLRYRCQRGGFYSHHEFDRYFALHHPGFSERLGEGFGGNEEETWKAIESAAGRLSKRDALPVPEAPLLYPPETVQGNLNLRWRGSTFASAYILERRSSADGAWKQIGPKKLGLFMSPIEDNVNMANGGVAFVDKTAGKGKVGYRLKAKNAAGESGWSETVEIVLS